jgi:hypothetical protein
VALRWARRDATRPNLVKIGSMVASDNYALATWPLWRNGRSSSSENRKRAMASSNW